MASNYFYIENFQDEPELSKMEKRLKEYNEYNSFKMVGDLELDSEFKMPYCDVKKKKNKDDSKKKDDKQFEQFFKVPQIFKTYGCRNNEKDIPKTKYRNNNFNESEKEFRQAGSNQYNIYKNNCLTGKGLHRINCANRCDYMVRSELNDGKSFEESKKICGKVNGTEENYYDFLKNICKGSNELTDKDSIHPLSSGNRTYDIESEEGENSSYCNCNSECEFRNLSLRKLR